MRGGLEFFARPCKLALRLASVDPVGKLAEAQLIQAAFKAGTDAEQLVKTAALRLLADEVPGDAPASEIPILHLGAMKSLHRRDLYDDSKRLITAWTVSKV